MKMNHRLIIVLSLLTLCLGAADFRIVDIRPKIKAHNDTIILSDIVVDSSQLTESEKTLTVMETPRDNNVKNLSIVAVAELLQKYTELHDIRLRGPSIIRFQRISNPELIDMSKKAILSYIEGNAPWKEWTVDVLLSPSDKHNISQVGYFKSVRVLSVDKHERLGNVSFRLQFSDEKGKEIKKEILVPLIVKKVNALVLKTNLRRGHIIKKSDLIESPTWVGKDRSVVISDLASILGKETRFNMNAGDLVKSKDLLNPIVARRGDLVWVTATKGKSLSVRLSVIALEDGRLGDLIKVRNNSSNKEFSVQLTSTKQAKLDL